MSTLANMPSFEIKASNTEGGDWQTPPAGLHPAVLIAFVDLGTHDGEYKGKRSKKRKVQLVYELTGEADSEGKNFIVSRDFTLGLGKNSNLRPFVEGWLGRVLEDGEPFDPLIMVGKPCMVNITITVKENKADPSKKNKYVKLGSVSKPHKNTTVPEATREPFVFHTAMLEKGKTPEIPEWIPRIFGEDAKDKIMESDEFKALHLTHGVPTADIPF